jgi:O-antigen/teichoic acid export membrane protein
VLAILLIPIGTTQASLVTTQRLESRAKSFALLQCIDLLAQMALAVTFVAIGWGAMGMVLGLVVGSTIGLGAAAIPASSLLTTRPNRDLCRAMLAEGLRFLPATLGFVVATYAVRSLLVDWQGQDAVGLFGVASRLAGGVTLAAAAFSMAWGPYGLGLPDTAHTARLFGRVIQTYALIAMFAAAAFAAVGPELVSLLAGNEYELAATMLPGLMAAATMSVGFYVLLVAAGISSRGSAVAWASVIGAAVQVGATLVLLPLIGLPTVGAAATFGQAVALVILVIPVRSSVQEGIRAVAALCACGAAVVAIGFLNLAPELTEAPRFVIAASAGTASLWLLLRAIRGLRSRSVTAP